MSNLSYRQASEFQGLKLSNPKQTTWNVNSLDEGSRL